MTRETTPATDPANRVRNAFFSLLIALAILVAGYFGFDLNGLFDDEPGTVPVAHATDWYQVWFTNPTCPPEDQRVGGLDEKISADIDRARTQVDVAAYHLEAPPILEALIEARKRGLTVRVVVDDGQTPATVVNRLRRNGMSVVEDRRSAFMHNKFAVIDHTVVWTGSMNFSPGDVYCYNNNLVRLESPELAANYTAEFEEMFVDRQFGPTSPRNTETQLTINGVRVENHFAPEGNVAANIARVIARAGEEVLFMAFSFTSEVIGEAVIERAQNGLTVRGVVEHFGSNTAGSYFGDFRRARLENLQVRRDGNPRLMHHKVFIIDRSIVIFGSFNFSNNADNSNDENVLIIYDPAFAAHFVEEFELVWAEAPPP
jgi:phosphatidylserine/phosphatidylglycerophosphate/cardiolipin synthase-like enzyme